MTTSPRVAVMRKLKPRQVVPVDVSKLDAKARAEIEDLRKREAFDTMVCNHFDRYCVRQQVSMAQVLPKLEGGELAVHLQLGVISPQGQRVVIVRPSFGAPPVKL